MSSTVPYVILDLDECAIKFFPAPQARAEGFDSSRGFFIITHEYPDCLFIKKRRHLDLFVQALHEKGIGLVVWSSGAEDYVKKICDIAFGRSQLAYVLTRKNLINGRKDIRILKNLVPGFDLKRAMLVDDNSENGLDNPDHFLLVPSFDGSDDDLLLDVLERVKNL